MIRLTRRGHGGVDVDPDEIQFVETVPETLVTLVDDRKLIVEETAEEVVARVVACKRERASRSAPSPRRPSAL